MIELLFPPQWTPTQPYLGLACLRGYLKEKGIKVHQTDVNILWYDYVLSKPFLNECKIIIERKYERSKGTAKRDVAAFYVLSDVIVDSIEEVKRNFKSEKSLNISEYLLNLKILSKALQLVSVSYDHLSLSLFDFKMPYNYKSSEEIFSAISAPENFFLSFYEGVVNGILKKKPSVCGISITGVNQIIPGLTLAGCIKKVDPSVLVVLGGSIITRWKECHGLKRVFEVCDAVVIKEGEEAVASLGAEPIEKIPNIGYKKEGKVIFNPLHVLKNLDELPPPDFEDLNLGSYFSPLTVLPVYASRACYWGKCAFCDHGYGYHKEYRVRSPERVVADLFDLAGQYNTEYFSFADEAISPHYFEKLCDQVIASGLDVTWFAHVRAEKGFTPHLCKKLYRSGCRMLLFGIESGCQKILDSMDKGTTTERAEKILRACRDAGLWNHTFLFFGFPGETAEDAQETIHFVCENKEVINSVGCSTFLCGKYSRICCEKEFEPVIDVLKNQEDLAIWHDYHVKKGLTPKEASKMRERLQKVLQNVYPPPLELICREHLIQLIDHGCTFTFSNSEKIPDIDSNFRPRLSKGTGLKVVPGDVISFIGGSAEINPRTGCVLYDFQHEIFMEISETAFEILQLCTRENSVEKIAKNLSVKYDFDFETVLKDSITFLREMVSKGVIEFELC